MAGEKDVDLSTVPGGMISRGISNGEDRADTVPFNEGELGAVREHFYPMFEYLEPCFLTRMARVFSAAHKKYGNVENYKKFDTEQILDIQRHAFQHIVDYMSGDDSEDHLANAACNLMFLMYFEQQGQKTNKSNTKSKYTV